MAELLSNPITGEILEATEETLQAAVNDISERRGVLYRRKDELLGPIRDELEAVDKELAFLNSRAKRFWKALAELRGPAVIPPPSRRGEVLDKVARCPRCRGDLVA